MAHRAMPAAQSSAQQSRSVISEPATVDACRRDYEAAASTRARFDENAKRFYSDPALAEGPRRARDGGAR